MPSFGPLHPSARRTFRGLTLRPPPAPPHSDPPARTVARGRSASRPRGRHPASSTCPARTPASCRQSARLRGRRLHPAPGREFLQKSGILPRDRKIHRVLHRKPWSRSELKAVVGGRRSSCESPLAPTGTLPGSRPPRPASTSATASAPSSRRRAGASATDDCGSPTLPGSSRAEDAGPSPASSSRKTCRRRRRSCWTEARPRRRWRGGWNGILDSGHGSQEDDGSENSWSRC